MYGKILVPLDGSSFSEHALPLAVGIALRTGAALELVTVADPSHYRAPDGAPGLVGDEAREKARQEAERYLEEVRGRIRAGAPGVATEVHALAAGNVVNSIARRIHQNGVDLTVMTTHGRGPVQRAWLGSTADGLVRSAPRPILLLRPDEDGAPEIRSDPAGFHHILIPLDGSPAAEAVLEHAPHLAAGGGKVTLLKAIPRNHPGGSPFLPHVVFDERERERVHDAAVEYLEEKAAGLRDRGLEAGARVVGAYQPAVGILEEVEGSDVDLVIMATEGRSGVSRLVLGSVADKVMRGVRCPILLHRAPREED